MEPYPGRGYPGSVCWVPQPWRSLLRRVAVVTAMTSGRLPPGQGGLADDPPPPPGAGRGGPPPPPGGGAAGGALEAP